MGAVPTEATANSTDEAAPVGWNQRGLQATREANKHSPHFLFSGVLIFLMGSQRNLTHLLGQQVNILFVASLRGVVELYQGQRLDKNRSEALFGG